MYTDYFSHNYLEARRRFQSSVNKVGGTVKSYPLGNFDSDNGVGLVQRESRTPLSFDVGIVGEDTAPTVLVSSAVHGVEGFLGSAIQLAALHPERIVHQVESQAVRFVFLHAVNPFGFANIRRFDQDGIDLNRNFLSEDQTYSDCSAGYRRLDPMLNPKSPPGGLEFFSLQAAWQILRFGLQPLKESIAGGQYEFPDGLFFGGKQPSRSFQLIKQESPSWIGDSQRVLHIDLHSGLGPFGSCKLLLAGIPSEQDISWYNRVFGVRMIETNQPVDAKRHRSPESSKRSRESSDRSARRTAYSISGEFGEWMSQRYADRDYRFVLAEFGTYGVLRVLKALRAENRNHHFPTSDRVRARVKKELLECFCPASEIWRNQTTTTGLKIISDAVAGLTGNPSEP